MYPHHIAKALEANSKLIGTLFNLKENYKTRINDVWDGTHPIVIKLRNNLLKSYKEAKVNLYTQLKYRSQLKQAFRTYQSLSDKLGIDNIPVLQELLSFKIQK